jgi:hypothetical protein
MRTLTFSPCLQARFRSRSAVPTPLLRLKRGLWRRFGAGILLLLSLNLIFREMGFVDCGYFSRYMPQTWVLASDDTIRGKEPLVQMVRELLLHNADSWNFACLCRRGLNFSVPSSLTTTKLDSAQVNAVIPPRFQRYLISLLFTISAANRS